MIKRIGHKFIVSYSTAAQAVILLSVFSMYFDIKLLHTFGIFTMGLITLEYGWVPGLPLLAFLLAPLYKIPELTPPVVMEYLSALMVWIGAGVLNHYRSWNPILFSFTVLLIFTVFMTYVFIPDLKLYWLNFLKDSIPDLVNAGFTKTDAIAAIQNKTHFITGFYLTFTALISTFYLFISALWYGSAKYSSSRMLVGSLSKVTLTNSYMITLLIVVLLYLADVYNVFIFDLVTDLTMVMIFAPCLVGLVILQNSAETLFQRLKRRKDAALLLTVILLYVVMLFLLLHLILFIAILIGLLDYMIDFRKRFKLKQT